MEQLRSAFLVTAHTKFEQVARLLSLLDQKQTDIFIHINKNVSMPNKKSLLSEIKESNVYFVENRVPIIWGGG